MPSSVANADSTHFVKVRTCTGSHPLEKRSERCRMRRSHFIVDRPGEQKKNRSVEIGHPLHTGLGCQKTNSIRLENK